MGGLNAPQAPVEAAAHVSRTTKINVVLIGDGPAIDHALDGCSYNPERLRVEESASGHPADSILMAVQMVNSGRANALVTAGDPPTVLRACFENLKLLPGVAHAPLAAVYPTAPRVGNRDPFALILDVGARMRPTADDLVAWARMGVAYSSRISKVEAPTVALLNVGRDPRAGTPELVEAHARLAADTSIRFVGNIEGLDIPRGAADVIVTDGFTGQVIVGLLGGLSDTLMTAARGAYEKSLTWRMGLKLLEGAVVRFQELIEHGAYGGAPLLGYDKNAILALPTSGKSALTNAIKLAAKASRNDVPSAVGKSLL